MQAALIQFQDPSFQILLIVIAVAGLVRGFAGFGTGMVIAPVGSFLFTPQLSMVIILLIDVWPILPFIPDAVRKARWNELGPVMVGILLATPFGVAFLKFGDVITLRWFIAVVIFLAVIILWSGWRYRGPRNRRTSISVGMLCGFLGGSSSTTGPPAIVYWIASKTPAYVIRANMMLLLFMFQFIFAAGLYAADLFTWDGILKGALASPIYLIGLLIGSRLFGHTSERFYQKAALAIIFLAALISMPLLDGILR